MNTVVTGGMGFIGSHLAKKTRGDVLDIKDGYDLRSYDILKKYDVIYHASANADIQLSFENPIEAHDHNVLVTLRILEYAKKVGAMVVFSSSSSVYEMMSPYAIQKKQCEDYMRYYWDLGVKSVALRYFNVYGEGQDKANGGYSLVLSKFLKQYKDGSPFTIVGDGEQRRDFVYVEDVVDANIKASKWLNKANKFRTFDIGFGKNHSVNEVANMISKDHVRINVPPRKEPFENRADIISATRLLNWRPATSLPQWIKSVKS